MQVMSISKLLCYKFSYFGLVLGIILGAFVTFFIPGKWESEALILANMNVIPIIRTQSFLSEAGKKSCSPNLAKSLNPRNNRNMRGYELTSDLYKLNILADSQEEASCYTQAVVATYRESVIKENKKELAILKKSIITFNDIFLFPSPPPLLDEGLTTYQTLYSLKVKILEIEELEALIMSREAIFPIVFGRKLPTISRLIIILFSGLIGLIIGILVSNNFLRKKQ